MKGVFFQKPFELCLQVDGETWSQNDEITGYFTAKNPGSAEATLELPRVFLVEGQLAQVRQKSPRAFEVLSPVVSESSKKMGSQKEEKFTWKFKLDRNCSITDKSSSLFLLYGQGESLEKLGQLQLIVYPEKTIGEIIQTWQTQFRFVLKTQKSNKGCVEIKFAPPDGRAYAAIEQMIASFCFENENLKAKYVFSVNKIDASVGNMELKKTKKEFNQVFVLSQYKTSTGRYHHEEMEKAIQTIMSQLGLGKVL